MEQSMKEPAYISDKILVQLAQKGDQDAYNTLLARYQQKVVQIIFFYTNDNANVPDLAQEVLLKVFRYLPEFKEESEFSTWLYRIAHNTVKNYFRSTSQRLDSESEFAKEQLETLSASPERQLINMELEKLLETAVEQLTEDLRLCYGLHLFEGQTYEDIAHRMQCPIGTVRSRIFRARKIVSSFVGDSM